MHRSGGGSFRAMEAGTFFAALLACFYIGQKKHRQAIGSLRNAVFLALLMAGMLALNACGSSNLSTSGLAQTGSSVITVTAMGTGAVATASPNFSATTQVSVNVTQ